MKLDFLFGATFSQLVANALPLLQIFKNFFRKVQTNASKMGKLGQKEQSESKKRAEMEIWKFLFRAQDEARENGG